MDLKNFDMRTILEFLPDQGKILMAGDRVHILRQEAMHELWAQLYNHLGIELTNTISSQFGYASGYNDYITMMKKYDIEDPMKRLSFGPVMHAHEGIVGVNPTFVEFDLDKGKFHMKGEWTNSYEAEIYLNHFVQESESPVCYSLTGYASGWCTAWAGMDCVAIERKCTACGDEKCEFEIKDRASWGFEATKWMTYLKTDQESVLKKLEQRNAEFERLNKSLEEKAHERALEIRQSQIGSSGSGEESAVVALAQNLRREIIDVTDRMSSMKRSRESGFLTDDQLVEEIKAFEASFGHMLKTVSHIQKMSGDSH